MMKFGIIDGIAEIGMETEEVEINRGNGQTMKVPGKQIGTMILVTKDGGHIPVNVAPFALSPLMQFARLLHHINKGDTIVANINDNEVHAALNQVHRQVDAMNAVAEKERERREFILESLMRMDKAARDALPEKVREEMGAHAMVLAKMQEEEEEQARADAMDDASRADCAEEE